MLTVTLTLPILVALVAQEPAHLSAAVLEQFESCADPSRQRPFEAGRIGALVRSA